MEKNIEDSNKKLIYQKNNEEISLQELIEKARGCYYLILNKWKIVALFMISSALIGFAISISKVITYTAEITYTLEENQNSNNNNLGLLASQLGVLNSPTSSSTS